MPLFSGIHYSLESCEMITKAVPLLPVIAVLYSLDYIKICEMAISLKSLLFRPKCLFTFWVVSQYGSGVRSAPNYVGIQKTVFG